MGISRPGPLCLLWYYQNNEEGAGASHTNTTIVSEGRHFCSWKKEQAQDISLKIRSGGASMHRDGQSGFLCECVSVCVWVRECDCVCVCMCVLFFMVQLLSPVQFFNSKCFLCCSTPFVLAQKLLMCFYFKCEYGAKYLGFSGFYVLSHYTTELAISNAHKQEEWAESSVVGIMDALPIGLLILNLLLIYLHSNFVNKRFLI